MRSLLTILRSGNRCLEALARANDEALAVGFGNSAEDAARALDRLLLERGKWFRALEALGRRQASLAAADESGAATETDKAQALALVAERRTLLARLSESDGRVLGTARGFEEKLRTELRSGRIDQDRLGRFKSADGGRKGGGLDRQL